MEILMNYNFHPNVLFLHTLRQIQDGRRFADDTFKCIFLNENVRISIKISLKFVPKDPINNIPALVQIMAWRRSGDKPLSEPMLVSLPTHIRVTRLQWVNQDKGSISDWNFVRIFHDDAISCKHFLYYWSFVRGISQSPED